MLLIINHKTDAMTKSVFDDLGKLLFHIGITVAAITLFRHFCLEFAVLRWTVLIIYAVIFPFVYWASLEGKRLNGLASWLSFGICQLTHYCVIGFLFGFDKYISLTTEHYLWVAAGLILYHEICEFVRKMCDATETDKDITSLIDEEKSTESHIVICDGVEEIPSNVFKYNRKMTNITIPNSVKYIASEAFWGCESLVEIAIPDSVKSIGSNAFWYCSSLKKVKLPCSIKEIDSAVFKHCRSLNDVVIPDSVKKIGSFAFGKCTSLKNIVIPSSTKVDETAFEESGVKKDETLLEKRRENDKFAEDEK